MKWLLSILFLACISFACCAQDTIDVARYEDGTRIYADTAIYQGMLVKLDIGTTILEAATSHGNIISVEGALSTRLKNHFYPTLDLGYARARTSANGGRSDGRGAFARIGMDLNALRKHAKGPHALLVGIRVGTAVQGYSLTDVTMNDTYWQHLGLRNFDRQVRWDVWGEVVGGCNVQVWAGLMMGWYVRLKIMFTRSSKQNEVMPYYVPGFGYRDNTNWGFNYYIAYKF